MSVMRTEAEVSSEVRAFERKTGILALAVHGTSVWQLLRFEVSLRHQGLELRRQALPRSRLVRSIVIGASQFLFQKRCRVLCKTFDSAHRVITAKGIRDIYFDDLVEALPQSVKMSSCDSDAYEERLSHAEIPPVFDDTSIIVVSAMLGRLFPVSGHAQIWNEISRAIVTEWGFADYTPERVRRLYSVFRWRSVLYRLFLWRCGAKVVICPDAGQFALLHAARLRNVPYIELQHGVYTRVHPNSLPADLSPAERVAVMLPDSLAVYGAFSAEALRGSALERFGRIDLIGAAFISKARALRAQRLKNEEPPTLLLTTQGVAREALVNFIAEFLTVCNVSFRLVIKLHPAYDSDRELYAIRIGNDPRVMIESKTSPIGTQDLIARADLHLSISSACHFDALGIGTPTGILALETHQSVQDLLEERGVVLIETPQDLAHIVAERSFPSVPDETSDRFFIRDFARNIEDLISRLETGRLPDGGDRA